MTDTERLNARVDALEMRMAHQDKTVDDLNETVMAQWKEIDALGRQIARLEAQVQELRDRAPPPGEEPPPPHY